MLQGVIVSLGPVLCTWIKLRHAGTANEDARRSDLGLL